MGALDQLVHHGVRHGLSKLYERGGLLGIGGAVLGAALGGWQRDNLLRSLSYDYAACVGSQHALLSTHVREHLYFLGLFPFDPVKCTVLDVDGVLVAGLTGGLIGGVAVSALRRAG